MGPAAAGGTNVDKYGIECGGVGTNYGRKTGKDWAAEFGTTAAMLCLLLLLPLGLGGVGVLEIVGIATKLICSATIWPVAVSKVLHEYDKPWGSLLGDRFQYGIASSPSARTGFLPGNRRRLPAAEKRVLVLKKRNISESEWRNNYLPCSSTDFVMWHCRAWFMSKIFHSMQHAACNIRTYH